MAIRVKPPDRILCSDCGSRLSWCILMSYEDESLVVEVESCKKCRRRGLEDVFKKDKIIQEQSYRIRDLEKQIGSSKKRKCLFCGHIFPKDFPCSCPHCGHPESSVYEENMEDLSDET